MTTEGRRSATEARLTGAEARIEKGFDWIRDHPKPVLGGIAGFVVLGLLTAGIAEWVEWRELRAQTALARVERHFAEVMGADPQDALVPEPANAEAGRKGREQALVAFESFIASHRRTRAAELAELRAAEVEADLEMFDAAALRIDALLERLDDEDPVRAVALRLLGYALGQDRKPLEAAEAYEQGARVEAYPDRGALWILAALAYQRAGVNERAVGAYLNALETDLEPAQQEAVTETLNALSVTGQRGAGGSGGPAGQPGS